jgi:hypothetical protein
MNRFKAPGSLDVSCLYEAESVDAGGKLRKDVFGSLELSFHKSQQWLN